MARDLFADDDGTTVSTRDTVAPYAPRNVPGMVSPGNVELWDRPAYLHDDYKKTKGYGTTESFSREDEDGKEVLVPQIIDGKRLTQDEAWAHYKKTNEHLGKFDDPDKADQYATALHNAQATYVASKGGPEKFVKSDAPVASGPRDLFADDKDAPPIVQPQSLGGEINDYVHGLHASAYSMPQGAALLGAKAADYLGLTKEAAPKLTKLFESMNDVAKNKFGKGGVVVGQGLQMLGAGAVAAPEALAARFGAGAIPAGLTTAANTGGDPVATAEAAAIGGGLGVTPAKIVAPVLGVAGAGYGAMQPGDLTSKAESMAAYGAGGFALGKAPEILSAAGKAGMNAIRGVLPETSKTAALDYVARILGNAGHTVESLEKASPDLTAAEAAGPTGETALMALGRREGSTPNDIAARMGERSATRSTRIMENMAQASGVHPAAAKGDIEDLVAAGRKTAAPMYKRALSGGSVAPLETQLNTEFNAASKRAISAQDDVRSAERDILLAQAKQSETGAPTVTGGLRDPESATSGLRQEQDANQNLADAQDALKQAEGDKASVLDRLRTSQDDAASGKRGGIWNPRIQRILDDPITKAGMARGLELERLEATGTYGTFDPKEYAVVGTTPEGPVVGRVPNMKLLDATKKGLDAIIDDAKDPITRRINWDERLFKIDRIRRNLVGELRAANPDYAEALNTSGDYLSSSQAFDQGQKAILNDHVTVKQFADMTKGMSVADRTALNGGIANKIFNQSQSGTLRPAKFLTPIARAKLRIALGDKADAFLNGLESEAGKALFEKRAIASAGSQTQPINEAMKQQDTFNQGAGHAFVDHLLEGKSLTSAAMHSAATTTGKITAMLKTSGLDVAARDEAGRLLLGSPQDLAKSLRSARKAPVKARAKSLGVATPIITEGLWGPH